MRNGRREGDAWVITGDSANKDLFGAVFPLQMQDGQGYRVRFRYRSSTPHIATRLWNDAGNVDVGMYLDAFPAANEWRQFDGEVSATNLGGKPAKLFVGRGFLDVGAYKVEVADLHVVKVDAPLVPYHPLRQQVPMTKTMVIFAEPTPTLRDLRWASQMRLSEGLGFVGTDQEKVLYSNNRALTWIADATDLTTHIVPSLNYSPDAYMRDSFWIAHTAWDRRAAVEMFEQWRGTQNDAGGIGTIVTPAAGSLENSVNDATLYYILWAYANHMRHGVEPTAEVKQSLQRALDFARRTFDPDGNGTALAKTAYSSDVMWFPEPKPFAVNQGMYAVTLRAAKDLGLNVRDDELKNAQDAYRAFYDPTRGYILHMPERPIVISAWDLVPEYVSFWFWNEPMLSSDAVRSHLDKMPIYHGALMPVTGKADGTFFTKEDHVFDRGDIWPGGVYANAGSYGPIDYCSLVAGYRHGWPKARELMQKRIDAELNMKPDEPCTHEWLPTGDPVWWPITRVFAWNAYMIAANEVAGIRDPSGDPHHPSRRGVKPGKP
jgi:hypothetical protein